MVLAFWRWSGGPRRRPPMTKWCRSTCCWRTRRAFEARYTVTGELVGDYGFRSDGTMWTQLNDDSYARDPWSTADRAPAATPGSGSRMPDAWPRDSMPPGGYRLRGSAGEVTATGSITIPTGAASRTSTRPASSSSRWVGNSKRVQTGSFSSPASPFCCLSLGLWLTRRREELVRPVPAGMGPHPAFGQAVPITFAGSIDSAVSPKWGEFCDLAVPRPRFGVAALVLALFFAGQVNNATPATNACRN